MPSRRPRKPRINSFCFLEHQRLQGDSLKKEAFMRDRFSFAKTLYRQDLKGHFGCVNAIEFSNRGGEYIVSGGDDRRVLLWKVEEGISGYGEPKNMKGEHHSNIFCLAFDNSNSKLYSGGNDEQVIVHDTATGATLDVFNHQDAVYGLSVDPLNDNVFASACDDGRILIYDTRAPPSEDPFCLANYMAQMHAVMYNPVEPRLLATANSKEGVGLWDIRKPRSCLLKYGGSLSAQSCMSVRINRRGDQVLALRRRLPPVLYSIHSPLPVYQFDHAGYYNSCTMKSCCFAGDEDQYVISGSDDFNLYVWKVPEDPIEVPWVGDAHLVLRGHRSIVNQVRFNSSNHLIISSGVEKVIKMWSPFDLPGSTIAPYAAIGTKHGKDALTTVAEAAATEAALEERPVYTQEEYFNLLLRSGQVISHDYSHESTEEDPRMMAFFDALVQRELQGFSSDDDSLEPSSRGLGHFAHISDSETSDTVVEHIPSNGVNDSSLARSNRNIAERSINDSDSDAEEHEGNRLLNLDNQISGPTSNGGAPSSHVLAHGSSFSGNLTSNERGSRPSISNLISVRRKDYVNNAKKIDTLARKRQRKKKEASSSSSSTSSSSSSDSSSSSSETDLPGNSSSKSKQKSKKMLMRRRDRKVPRINISDKESSPERDSGVDSATVEAICRSMTAQKNSSLERLKRLRTRYNKTDDSSDCESGSQGTMRSCFNAADDSASSCVGVNSFERASNSNNDHEPIGCRINAIKDNTKSSFPECHQTHTAKDITSTENGDVNQNGDICDLLSEGHDTNGANIPKFGISKEQTDGNAIKELPGQLEKLAEESKCTFKKIQNHSIAKRKYRKRSQDE